MSIIRRSFGLSAASKYTQFILMLGSNVAIARLLAPNEIGIYAVAAVLAGIAQTFRDLGIGQYLIREPEIDHDKLRVSFTLMTSIAWTLGLGLFAVSGVIADFYGEPTLQEVLQVQALTFFIIPFGAISLTLLKRAFRFGANYFIELSSSVVRTSIAITLAAVGFGAVSLAWASVAGVLVTVIGAVIARRKQFAFWPTLRGAKAVLNFGGYVTGSQILGTMNRDVPELLIGKFMGTDLLAFFNKAMLPSTMFTRFFMGALRPVLLPAFSKKHREQAIEPSLLHGLACLTAIAIPALVLAAFVAEYLVMALFGPQWGTAVEPMRILAVGTALWSISAAFPQLLMALGYPRALFRSQVVLVSVRVALVVVAMPYGLMAIAFAWLGGHVLLTGVRLWQVHRYAGIAPATIYQAIHPALLAGGALAMAIGITVQALGPEVTTLNSLVVLGVSGVLLCVTWVPCLRWLRHPLYDEIVGLISKAFRRSRAVS